jgi:hypothetical protein
MFRNTASVPAVESPPVGTRAPADLADLIPISVIALDLAEPPAGGWIAYLTSRGIPIVLDHIGREAIDSADARQLLDERREAEVRRREAIARNEQRAIEADRLHRSQIWQGVPADSLPVGVAPAAAMLQSAKDAQPKRESPMEEAFAGETMRYHAWPSEDES